MEGEENVLPEPLNKAVTALNDTLKNIKSQVEENEKEVKAFGQTSEASAKKLVEYDKRFEQVTADIKGWFTESEELKAIKLRLEEIEKKGGRPKYGDGLDGKSLGERFVESEEYKSMISSKRMESAPFGVPNLFSEYMRGYGELNLVRKALTTGATSGGEMIVPFRWPDVVSSAVRPLRIRDLLPVESTTQSSLEYVQETGFTTEAAPNTQAHGAAKPVAEGGTKPEARLTFTLKTSNARTIAHWIAATRQAISDAPQLRAYVDSRLLYGLYYAEEQQLLYGDGTDPNLQGILTHPDVQEYAWSDGELGDTKIDAVRRAMTLARLAQYPATGVVLHPNDWEDIELQKGDDKHYIWVTVPDGGVMRLWRLPVVETDAIVEGEFAVGAFRLGAMLWDREDASIRVSEHHASFFIQNMIAILAEERVMLTIFRPEAFVKGTFDAEPVAP